MQNTFTQNTPPHVRFGFLLLIITLQTILNPKLFPQTENPQATNAELVFQVQSTEPYDGTVIFIVSHVNGAEIFCSNGCDYSVINESFPTCSLTIGGNYYENTDVGLSNEAECSSQRNNHPTIIETRYSFYKIIVDYYNGPQHFIRNFYYDNRDCGFLGGTGCSSCPNKGDNDLTIRFDADANKLYLYNGHNTDFINNLQQNPNWTEVGTSSYTSIK